MVCAACASNGATEASNRDASTIPLECNDLSSEIFR